MDRFRMNIKKDDILSLNQKIDEYNNDPRFYGLKVTSENFGVADSYIKELENCTNCPGLDNCPNHQKGYYYVVRDNEFKLTRCNKYRQYENINKQHSFVKSLYMPSSVYEASLENFDITDIERKTIYKEAVNFIDDLSAKKFHKGLLLIGNFNTGKTYLLSAVANELAKHNISTLLAYVPDLVRQIKSLLGKDSYEDIINELKTVDVLMLDDLGSENMSSWLRDDVLGPIFNYRAAEGKPVCISTNLSLDQLRRHFSVDQDNFKPSRLLIRIQDVCSLFKFSNNQHK